MFWLITISNSIAALACLMGLAAAFSALRRQGGCALMWQGRALPVVVLAAVVLALVSERFDAPLPHIALVLTARLMFLGAVILLWPILREFAARPAAPALAHELARAEATDSRHWLQLAEKIARVCHWRYAVADDKITWSDQMAAIFGLPPDGNKPDLGTVFNLIAADDRPRAQAGFERALKFAAPFEVTVKIPQENGGCGHVTARGVPELDEAGDVTAVFGVFVDISAQKRIEEELKNANQASEMANKALEALALHDPLTRLANRRHFDGSIASEFRRAAREMQMIGLLMIDLDHFKAYNDHYGHPAGDICLRRVAEAIAAVPQRPADLVARYGGEEIAVLLPNTSLAGTETVADLIVRAVRELRIPHAGNPELIVTVSCGVAVFDPQNDPYIPVKLIERADLALYQAKNAGRNRACSGAMAA